MQTRARVVAVLLSTLALAGCTAPAEPAAEVSDVAAREESRDRVRELVTSLPVPQDDAFAFARAADAADAEGVELIGIESYEPTTEGGPFGSLTLRTPVDSELFPDAGELPEAFCFQVPLTATGIVAEDGDGGVEPIDCAEDADVITPPAA